MSEPAALTLGAAAATAWPVVVVGAGPAGAFLALGLARAGVRVLLLDKATFPRTKVCGCCLNGAALRLLEAAHLGGIVSAEGAVPLTHTCLSAGGRSVRLALPRGAALSRQAFDVALIRAAVQAGAAFLPATTARLVGDVDPECRRLQAQQVDRETTLQAQLVVAADGLGGRLLAGEPGHRVEVAPAARIGVGAVVPEQPFFQPGTIYMACGAAGYVGLVRLEDGRLDVAAALDPLPVARQGIAEVVARILAPTGWPLPGGLAWRGTPTLTRRAPRPGGRRCFLVGDAAGYVEPFTGEGIAWALASAAALVPVVLTGLRRWRPSLVDTWSHRLHELLAGRRRFCGLVTGVLRRPVLTALVVRLLRCCPGAAAPVLALFNRPLGGRRR